MSDNKKVDVQKAIFDSNDQIAQVTNNMLTAYGIFCINVMGAPGVGKTSAIVNIIKGLNGLKPYVLEGDIESDIDTASLKKLGVDTVQINTHGACHLDAPVISGALDSFDKSMPGVLFIENIGNLVCPAEFVIGEHIKMLIVSVTDGSDKPYKYPLAFEKADIILINKADLLSYVDFDEEFFMKGVRTLNPNVPVFKVSGKQTDGFEEVIAWIKSRSEKM